MERIKAFRRISINNNEDWLEERQKHIQASDAATILGVSPWRTQTELWDEKKGLKKAPDISDKPYVIYGKNMEPYIRAQFLLDCPYFECEYHEFDILVNRNRPWQACTLDGELTVIADNPWNLPIGSKGVLECKTGQWRNYRDLTAWEEFPIHYYAQQCHQLAVTEWAFNLSASRIVRAPYKDDDNGFPEIRTLYHIVKAQDALDDIVNLIQIEHDFYQSLRNGIRPSYWGKYRRS